MLQEWLRAAAVRNAAPDLAPSGMDGAPVFNAAAHAQFGNSFSQMPASSLGTAPTQAEPDAGEMDVEPPSKKRKRQTHLGFRPQQSKDPAPLLAATETYDRDFGEEASRKRPRVGLPEAYRLPTVQYGEGRGGAGFDEIVSTATTNRARTAAWDAGLSNEEAHSFVGDLSSMRAPVGDLLWSDPTNPDRPMSGHPGALSKVEDDNTRGLTGGHNTKDRRRAAFVNQELAGLAPGNQRETAERMRVMGQVLTVSEMSQPFSQLSTVDPTKATDDAYHAKHGQVIDNRALTPNFLPMIADVHNARERLKTQTASGLIGLGHANLVAPEMTDLLTRHGGDPDEAISARYDAQPSGLTDSGPPTSQTRLPETGDAMTLADMSAQNDEDGRNGTPMRHRALSAPRPFIKPGLPSPMDVPLSLDQRKITDFWG